MSAPWSWSPSLHSCEKHPFVNHLGLNVEIAFSNRCLVGGNSLVSNLRAKLVRLSLGLWQSLLVGRLSIYLQKALSVSGQGHSPEGEKQTKAGSVQLFLNFLVRGLRMTRGKKHYSRGGHVTREGTLEMRKKQSPLNTQHHTKSECRDINLDMNLGYSFFFF